MSKTEQRKEYAAVDIFKFFCAILVIAIHAKPFVNIFWLDAAVGLATRFAVPYFFLSSAYFLFKKLSKCEGFREKSRVYFAYLLRLLRFYAIWFVIFNLVDIALGASVQSPLWYIRQFVFTTNGSPLWFLSALIWGTLIVFLLSSFLNKYAVFGISCVFLVLGYMLTTLLNVTGEWGFISFINQYITPVIGTQNGLYFAFPYVALGALMSAQTVKKEHKKNSLLAVLFFVLLGAESVTAVVILKAPLTFIWLSALPMTYFIMRLTLSIETISSAVFYYMRKMSTMIYVVHCVVLKLLQRLFALTPMGAFDRENILLFALTVALSAGIAFLTVRASKVKGFGFLKFIM